MEKVFGPMSTKKVAQAIFFKWAANHGKELGEHFEDTYFFYELTVEGTEEMARRAKEIVVTGGPELRSEIAKLHGELRAYASTLKKETAHSNERGLLRDMHSVSELPPPP